VAVTFVRLCPINIKAPILQLMLDTFDVETRVFKYQPPMVAIKI
jgi:hypothetical protein